VNVDKQRKTLILATALLAAMLCAVPLAAFAEDEGTEATATAPPAAAAPQPVPEILIPSFFLTLKPPPAPWARAELEDLGWSAQVFQVGWVRELPEGKEGLSLLAQRMAGPTTPRDWVEAMRSAFRAAGQSFTEWLVEDHQALGRPAVTLGVTGPADLPKFGRGPAAADMVLTLLTNGPDILQAIVVGPSARRETLKADLRAFVDSLVISRALPVEPGSGGTTPSGTPNTAAPASGGAGPQATPQPGSTAPDSSAAVRDEQARAVAILSFIRTIRGLGLSVPGVPADATAEIVSRAFPADSCGTCTVPVQGQDPRSSAHFLFAWQPQPGGVWTLPRERLAECRFLVLVDRSGAPRSQLLVLAATAVRPYMEQRGDTVVVDAKRETPRGTVESLLEAAAKSQWAGIRSALR
jgi:hypothetical protein